MAASRGIQRPLGAVPSMSLALKEPDVPHAGPTANGRSSLIDLEATFLPVGQMRQISRVTPLKGAAITGEVDLSAGHWVYAQHFPGDPIFPGTLLIEAAGQLVALWAWAQGQRGRPRLVRTSAEFHFPVGPTHDHLLLRGSSAQETSELCHDWYLGSRHPSRDAGSSAGRVASRGLASARR